MAHADWQVWSTTAPDAIEVSETPATPEEAVRDACLWNCGIDGCSWFGGGVATVVVVSPEGERWTCAVVIVMDERLVELTPMVPA